MIPHFVETQVEIVEVLSARTSRAKLPNGRLIFTFIDEGQPEIAMLPGQKVTVRVNLADFSRGMIIKAD